MALHYKIGGYSFSTYWTVFFLGIVCMIIMNCIRAKKKTLKQYQSVLLTITVVLISFLGAKILYYMEQPKILLESGIRFGGVSFFGSVFLVPVIMMVICKKTKLSYHRTMDFLSPSLMLMLAILRVGCLISDCCGGTSVVFAGVYVEKFPTQITECVFDLLILAGILIYEKYWQKEGRLYYFIMVYYGIIRFFIEFLRDTPKDWFYMSHGQWFSIISVCAGGWMLRKIGRQERKKAYKANRKNK